MIFFSGKNNVCSQHVSPFFILSHTHNSSQLSQKCQKLKLFYDVENYPTNFSISKRRKISFVTVRVAMESFFRNVKDDDFPLRG
jgi:hypothetical protein